jgi:hypothetical protein
MPPSKPACEILAEGYEIAGDIVTKWRSVKSASKNIKKILEQLKYGIVDLADVLGADLLSAIASVASNVAETYLGTISKMASSIFEYIFSLMLQILLAAPTAIFSLVAIPHDAAKKAARREAIFLAKARGKVRIILHIILKWTGGRSGTNYYKQMKDALPFITKAITLCSSLISKLEGDNTEEDGDRNAVFDKGIYKKIRGNINAAINITEPKSALEQRLGLNRRIQADKSRRFREKRQIINVSHAKKKLALTREYKAKISRIKDSGGTIGNPDGLGEEVAHAADRTLTRTRRAGEEHIVKLEYENALDLLELEKKEKLAIAESVAETEAVTNGETYVNAFSDLGSEFSSDMRRLGDCLIELLEHIRDAYKENKKSQLHCNTVYDSRNIITNIVKEMVSFLRNGSNKAANAVIAAVEAAQSGIEIVEENFIEATEKFENPDRGSVSASEMALKVAGGNVLLKTADAGLEASITESLVDLINSDDILQSANKEFDEFAARLFQIPDWDGEVGVWSVALINSSVSPYIGLIADITEAVAKVPILSFTGSEADKKRVSSLIKAVDKRFRVLSRHNGIVAQTLQSYVPYSSSEAGDLKKFLDKAGLLGDFATGMSLTVLAADLATNFKGRLGNEWPSYDNCKTAYPDLFDKDILATAAVEKSANLEDPSVSIEAQEAREEVEGPLRDHNKIASTTNYNSDDVLGAGGQDTVPT